MPAQATPSSSNNKVFVDPRDFLYEDCPIIVLVDDLRGGIGWIIKEHTAGNYCHAMTLLAPDVLASQNWLFERKKLEQYMKPSLMLKFWRIKDLTRAEKLVIENNILNRLALPWYKRRYDYLGIFGQALNIKWIQSPFGLYCSEEVAADYLNAIPRALSLGFHQPSPADLDRIFKTNPDVLECLGYWWDS